jgi:hypothetical protein
LRVQPLVVVFRNGKSCPSPAKAALWWLRSYRAYSHDLQGSGSDVNGWRSEDRQHKFTRYDPLRDSTALQKADTCLRSAPAKMQRERKSAGLRSSSQSHFSLSEVRI